jgi:hypothetical protein
VLFKQKYNVLFKQKYPADNGALRKCMPLDLIPGWVPVLRTTYAQIELGAFFEQIRAKPQEHSREP